jgi:hypothetical protein
MKLRFGIPSFTRYSDYWLLWIPLFVGSINVKAIDEPLLFSERYGKRKPPTIVLGRFRFSWVRFR